MNSPNSIHLRLVFLSGSLPVYASEPEYGDEEPKALSAMEKQRMDRFSAICESIGEAIGREGLGIAGCAPHFSRVLASQEASRGLLRANPKATFTTEGMRFPLNDDERLKFIQRVCAGVFVAGTEGTRREFELCKKTGICPLIPIAGAGGTGAQLARELLSFPSRFLKQQTAASVLNILNEPDASPNDYAGACIQIIRGHLNPE